jgi:hypothetical protein
MQSFDFEDQSIFDLEGNEWLVSGTYYADMDRSGEYEEDGFKSLLLVRINEDEALGEAIGTFPDRFSEEAISKLSEVLAQKLFDQLTGGQS